MTVIGIDTSLTGTGVASSEGWCKLIGRKGITTLPLTDRVHAVRALSGEIGRVVLGAFMADHVDLVLIEMPAFSRAGGGAVERHALFFTVVELILGNGIPIIDVAPTARAKYATGKGNASKSAVIEQITRRLPQYATGGNDNLCDAVALAAMGADHLGEPIATFPESHRAALRSVAWQEALADVH